MRGRLPIQTPLCNEIKDMQKIYFQDPRWQLKNFLVNISQFQRFGDLCLCEILMHLNQKGLNIKDYKFHLPKLGITIEAGDKCLVPFDVMVDKEVIFQMSNIPQEINWGILTCNYNSYIDEQNYSPVFVPVQTGWLPTQQCVECQECGENSMQKQVQEDHPIPNNSNQSPHHEDESNASKSSTSNKNRAKKVKQHQKTVQQALYLTKKWRKLHQVGNFSLKNAAEFVGISKKTLDDYFLVLRVGEQLGYDYSQNLLKKIGHLRNFIRSQPIKVKGRLHKDIQSFKLVAQPDINSYLPIKNWAKLEHVDELHRNQNHQETQILISNNAISDKNQFPSSHITQSIMIQQGGMGQ